MKRLAILTPDPADEAHHGRWGEVFERMAAPLRAAGVAVEGRAWVEAGALSGFDLVLPLTVWGYHRGFARWIEATRAWEAAGVRLANPPGVLSWNADKRYLATLAEAGAPIVPTDFVERLTPEAVEAAAARFRTRRLVVKPQVSASAYRTLRLTLGDPLDGGPEGPAMIQPYLPRIETEGELSLLYFEGRFSHALRKVPRHGDFRVQPEYDGAIRTVEPEADELAAAGRILAAVQEPLLYARVDLVRGFAGEPLLIELELIEPDLYLNYDPRGGAAFVRAVLDRLEA